MTSATTMAASKKPAKGKADAKSSAKNGAKAQAKADKTPEPPKRKLGLRGAAPWAARHAAKHAAEARARAAEPPLPGSARATIRTPAMAEDIKQKIADLHNSLQQIKAFRKNLAKGFYDVGVVLNDIKARNLYQAKGFGTFEAFLERETAELGKTTALRKGLSSSAWIASSWRSCRSKRATASRRTHARAARSRRRRCPRRCCRSSPPAADLRRG
jgi:hypothetical protein